MDGFAVQASDKTITRAEFLRLLEVQMEIPGNSLQGDQLLTKVEGWDSLAAVLFIALADEKTGVRVTGKDIARARTIDDLLALLGNRIAG